MFLQAARFKPALLIILLTLLVSCADDKPKKLQVGDIGPSFSGVDLNGNNISLVDYKGKPVILRFWSTDCKYCRADTPIFNDYFNKYKAKGLNVFYINNAPSDTDEIKEFVADLDIQFPVILDHDGKIAASYQVKIVPQTIILDPNHRIMTAILGGVSEAELQELLSDYL